MTGRLVSRVIRHRFGCTVTIERGAGDTIVTRLPPFMHAVMSDADARYVLMYDAIVHD